MIQQNAWNETDHKSVEIASTTKTNKYVTFFRYTKPA